MQMSIYKYVNIYIYILTYFRTQKYYIKKAANHNEYKLNLVWIDYVLPISSV